MRIGQSRYCRLEHELDAFRVPMRHDGDNLLGDNLSFNLLVQRMRFEFDVRRRSHVSR